MTQDGAHLGEPVSLENLESHLDLSESVSLARTRRAISVDVDGWNMLDWLLASSLAVYIGPSGGDTTPQE